MSYSSSSPPSTPSYGILWFSDGEFETWRSTADDFMASVEELEHKIDIYFKIISFDPLLESIDWRFEVQLEPGTKEDITHRFAEQCEYGDEPDFRFANTNELNYHLMTPIRHHLSKLAIKHFLIHYKGHLNQQRIAANSIANFGLIANFHHVNDEEYQLLHALAKHCGSDISRYRVSNFVYNQTEDSIYKGGFHSCKSVYSMCRYLFYRLGKAMSLNDLHDWFPRVKAHVFVSKAVAAENPSNPNSAEFIKYLQLAAYAHCAHNDEEAAMRLLKLCTYHSDRLGVQHTYNIEVKALQQHILKFRTTVFYP